MNMNRLISLLQQFQSPDVFNPWRDNDPLDAPGGAAAGRFLRLEAHFSCEPKLLLIGEAPGYQDRHFSGVPFTSERLLIQGAIPRISSPTRLTTRLRPWSEPSATIVWGALSELDLAEDTVLWNAFAWHPHEHGQQLSNRKPKRQELEAGLFVLKAVIEHFHGVVRIIPVGQVAAGALTRLGITTGTPTRHPAFGGAQEFRSNLRDQAQAL